MSENVKLGKKERGGILLAIGAIVGILLLLFGSSAAARGEKKNEESAQEVIRDPEAYAREIEAKVEELCRGVTGAGKVRAAVTLKGGYRARYATDAKSSSGGYQSSTVLVGSGSSEEALLVCYENPEIAGIGIVCEGGENAEVRARIIALVSATFSIGTNKISVVSGQVS